MTDDALALGRKARFGDDCPHRAVQNPDLHATGAVFDLFAELRAQGPVVWSAENGSDGFWAVLGHTEAGEVLKQPEVFAAGYRHGGNRLFDTSAVTAQPARMLLALDPPDHGDLRRVLVPFFTPEAVDAQRSTIRERALRLVTAIAPHGRAEFVRQVSVPLTMGLATDLMGLPEEMGGPLERWTSILIADDDPDLQPSLQERRAAIAEFDSFAMGLFSGATATTNDLIPALRAARVGGTALDFNDFSVNLIALAIAFGDTTRHAISNAVVALDTFPALRQALLDDPALIPAAGKEIIRWTSPLAHVRRTALRNVTLGGQAIRKGDRVVVWYGAVNRDPMKWDDPDTVQADRFARRGTPATLAFGAGNHHCLGWRLAEMEVALMLEVLLATLPDIAPEGPARYIRSNFVHGIKTLPVRFTPRA